MRNGKGGPFIPSLHACNPLSSRMVAAIGRAASGGGSSRIKNRAHPVARDVQLRRKSGKSRSASTYSFSRTCTYPPYILPAPPAGVPLPSSPFLPLLFCPLSLPLFLRHSSSAFRSRKSRFSPRSCECVLLFIFFSVCFLASPPLALRLRLFPRRK